jgi:hypothetical protein
MAHHGVANVLAHGEGESGWLCRVETCGNVDNHQSSCCSPSLLEGVGDVDRATQPSVGRQH